MTAVANNLFLIPIGDRMAVIRPEGLATDWAWRVYERDDPSVVVDFSPLLIMNSTRHVFITIDATKYEPDKAYTLQILDNALSVEEEGDFQVFRAAFGRDAAVDFNQINAQIKLALGLAGLNNRVEHSNHDPVTGIPLRSVLTIYTDEELSDVLARYTLIRSLDAVGLVTGEVQFRTEYDPSAIPPCPSNPSEPSAPF